MRTRPPKRGYTAGYTGRFRGLRYSQALETKGWMGARVVEGTGLENRQGLTLLVGSNPTPSANNLIYSVIYQ
jgi:hypothetical protein